jgi:hypothetical protein
VKSLVKPEELAELLVVGLEPAFWVVFGDD